MTRFVQGDNDRQKESTLAVRGWEIFGFGAQYVWFLSIIVGSLIYSATGDYAWMQDVKIAFIISMACFYAVSHIFQQRIPQSCLRGFPILIAGASGTLGTIIVTMPFHDGGPVTLVIAALLVGFSNLILMSGGNAVWARSRSGRMMIHLSLSAFVAAVLYFVLALLHPVIVACALSSLPLLGSLILFFTETGRPRAASFRIVSQSDRKLMLRLILFVVAFSFTTGALLGTICTFGPSRFESLMSMSMPGALLACAFALGCALRLNTTGFLKQLYAFGTSFLVVGVVLLLVLPEPGIWLGCSLVLFGYVVLDLFMWALNAELVSRTKRSSFEILGQSYSASMFSLGAGVLVGLYCSDPIRAFAGFSGAFAILALSSVLLVLTNSFVFTPFDVVRAIEARENFMGSENHEERCAVLAERYALSTRESEVLVFLAAGRSAPFIREELGVSQSTVKSHIQHIYRKMGIKGKQELISLIEHADE